MQININTNNPRVHGLLLSMALLTASVVFAVLVGPYTERASFAQVMSAFACFITGLGGFVCLAYTIISHLSHKENKYRD